MRHKMFELSQFDLVYDLSVVLIHKGTGANSGHYIAHIKDVNTGNGGNLIMNMLLIWVVIHLAKGLQILPLNPSRLMQFILIVLKR